MANKLKVRITKCYLVEVVDKNGYVQFYTNKGEECTADDFCFGTKDDAMDLGRKMIEKVKESEV